MIKKYFALSIIAASVAVAGCSSDDDSPTDVVVPPVDPIDPVEPVDPVEPAGPVATPGVGGTAFDTIVNSVDHQMLEDAIIAAGLADTLDDPANAFTIFAPTDAAFAALNTEDAPTTVADLVADVPALTRVLSFHVVPGTVDSTALSTLITDAGEDAATIDSILADGGVAQAITLTTSTTANAGIAVNGIDVDAADVGPDADGIGLVHVISAVLTPAAAPVDPDPVDPIDPVDPVDPPVGGPVGAVASALGAAGNFSGFLGLGFLEAYEDNTWTVFAPTDEAIAASATAPDVQNHIAVNAGALTAAELIAAGTIATNNGVEYAVTGTAGALLIDGNAASLVATGTNGTLVYSLDGVLQ